MSVERSTPIRVGVVGANPSRGWGTTAHLPALQHLPEFVLAAVATTRQASAQETAEAFGVPLAFAGAEDLVTHPEVDLVAITVKVPDHAAVVRAALAAGKHVVSEWPLGVDVAEARDLAETARGSGVVHAVGLQGVHAPGARFAADLLRQGRIGQLRSVSMIASSGLGGSRLSQSMAWVAAPGAGVSVLSITGGHVLATLAEVLGGPFRDVCAVVANLDDQATVIETGETIGVGTPGQVVLVGTLADGALLSVTLQGGTPPAAAGFILRIVGTDGALAITPAQPGGSLHISEWRLMFVPLGGPAEELEVPARYRLVPATVPAGPPANVAALYLEVARAIAERRQPYPSFDTAVRYHELLATIEAASKTGARQAVGSLP